MQKSLILVPLLVAIVLGISPSKATNPKTQAAVVVLDHYQRWTIVDGNYVCNGLGVQNSSSSSNAPAIHRAIITRTQNGAFDDPNAVEIAQAIADLLDQGFRLDRIAPDGKLYLIRQ